MREPEVQTEMRNLLRGLPSHRAPEELRLALRIAASKESANRRRWAAMPVPFVRLRESFELWKANMMRPLALPFAGGLTAAILVFTMFVHTYPVRANFFNDTATTEIYTAPMAKTLAPFEPATADAEIEVTIDELGRIANYAVVGGDESLEEELRRSVERTLLFTEFTPATSFGQAISSKLRITLRRGSSALTVKG